MFEEDVQRCFICENPCKPGKLFCSDKCQHQDQGRVSPPAKHAPVHMMSQLPPSLSPMLRPAFAPSPRITPHNDYSSNSSITSSPLHSPDQLPQETESPHKEPLALPEPAYGRHQSFAFASIPVKIPAAVPKPSPMPAPVGSQGTPLHGTSIDTLRFGRRPGVVNSIISPNALLPRCACGKPANHRSRAASKERLAEPDFARLTLGPSVLHPSPRLVPIGLGDKPRVASEGMLGGRPVGDRKAHSGHATPYDGLNTSSLLSRSRSDPIPPNLQHPPKRALYDGFVSPSPSRRASAAAADQATIRHSGRARAMTRTASGDRPRARVEHQTNYIESEPRGRSRSRARPSARDIEAHHGLFDHAAERESAPSRSRHRRDEHERNRDRGQRSRDRERERERERGREPASARDEPFIQPLESPCSPITPSWSRLADAGEVVAPSAKRSPKGYAVSGRAY